MVKAKTTRKRQTKAFKAGLVFPVSRFHRMLRLSQSKHARVSAGAAVYTAAVAEYMVAELTEMAGNACQQMTQKRITPRHIMLAIKNDEEMYKLLKNVSLPSAGVVPNILPALLPAKQISASKPALKAAGKKMVVKQKAAKNSAAKVQSQTQILAAARKVARGYGKGIVTLTERALMHGHMLKVLSGDIVNIQADCFIIPSSNNYTLGGQVGSHASAIGGAAFQQNISQLGGTIQLTQSAVCQGANFASPYVMLCNGPTWSSNPSQKAVKDLTRTVSNCFELAEENLFQSIAFPSIGSGNASFPKHIAAQTILRAISDFYKTHPKSKVQTVYFVLYDQESIDTYVRELGLMHE